MEGDDLTVTDILGIPFTVWGPGSLLALVILMLLWGKLWTDKAYQEKKEEAKIWRAAYEASEKARAEAFEENKKLFKQAEATHAIVVAMFGVVRKGGTEHALPLG